MANFTARLDRSAGPLWLKMLDHPFLEKTMSNAIEDEIFAQWLRQDYIFVQEAIPFIAIIAAKAPLTLRGQLANVIPMLVGELAMFEEMARQHNVGLDNLIPSPTCHAYLQYLHATAQMRSFEEMFTLFYAAEKAYYDSWKKVKDNLPKPSKWQRFIDYWSSDQFGQYIAWLAGELNQLAEGLPEEHLAKMEQQYLMAVRYEYMFWTMAQTSEAWPV